MAELENVFWTLLFWGIRFDLFSLVCSLHKDVLLLGSAWKVTLPVASAFVPCSVGFRSL